jgi:hypothetical protein
MLSNSVYSIALTRVINGARLVSPLLIEMDQSGMDTSLEFERASAMGIGSMAPGDQNKGGVLIPQKF